MSASPYGSDPYDAPATKRVKSYDWGAEPISQQPLAPRPTYAEADSAADSYWYADSY